MVQAIARLGLIPEELLPQFYKWKLIEEVGPVEPPATKEKLRDAIEALMVDDGMALVRETDLDIVKRYFATQKVGILSVVLGDPPQSSPVQVAYGMTLTGEYIFPWQGDDTSLMVNGQTHLVTAQKHVSGERTFGTFQYVYFCDVKEVYFDNAKAFMVCTPSTVEELGHG